MFNLLILNGNWLMEAPVIVSMPLLIVNFPIVVSLIINE